MMRQMRKNTKWIMLLTALAFFALMVFEWGMDASGQSGGGTGSIGSVNGTAIPFEQYQTTRSNLYQQLQESQEDPITNVQDRELDQAAWDETVNQILISQELVRRGISVTDEEIQQAARFSPPPAFRNASFLQTDGVFDMQKYQQYLATVDEATLLGLEAYYRDVIPRGKLLRQVSTGLYVTDAELWRAYQDQNEQVAVRFASIDAQSRISDEAAAPTEAELEDYYDANIEDYDRPARASIRAVVIPKVTTAADSAAAAARIADIRAEVVDGGDFAAIAERESADRGSAELGGELGWFPRGRMTAAFDSTAFAAPIGQLTQPFRSQFGWHILEVIERAGDSANARHILIPIEQTEDSEFELLTLADSLEALLESGSFDDAARTLNLDVQTVDVTQEFPFVQGAGSINQGADWALEEAELREISEVFENQQAFYAVEVLNVTEARTLSLDEARQAIEQIVLRQKKLEMAADEARAAVSSANASTLDAIATALGTSVTTTEPFTRGGFAPGLGSQNAAIGTAFGLESGEISDLVLTDNDGFYMEVVERIPADSAAFEEQKALIRLQRQNAMGQSRLQLWLEGLRENARIVDRREQVLQPADAVDAPRGGLFGVGL